VLVSKVDLREIGCEDGRWMELSQDRVQWQTVVLAVLNLGVLLPKSCLINYFISTSVKRYTVDNSGTIAHSSHV
jgi:hypothetical protein